MVKTINVDFDDEEFEELTKTRGETWREYIVRLSKLDERLTEEKK